MFVMEKELNNNPEINRIFQNALQNSQHINIIRSTGVIGAFQHLILTLPQNVQVEYFLLIYLKEI